MKSAPRNALIAMALTTLLVVPTSSAMPAGGLGATTGDGSTAFTGLAQAPEANLFLGAATMTVPFEVPSGRKNMTPNLALTYSSSGGHSPYGYGWDLPLGRIQRCMKHGVLSCDDDRYRYDFVLVLPGANIECRLDVNAAGNVKPCVPLVEETFHRIEYHSSDNHWRVWDRSGALFRFGIDEGTRTGSTVASTAAALFDNSVSPCQYTFSWALAEARDPDGNHMSFDYSSIEGVLYPTSIQYGGNETTDLEHLFAVIFEWDADFDSAPGPAFTGLTNTTGGFPATLKQRLKHVTAYYDGDPIRRYGMTYNRPANHASVRLLEAVTLFEMRTDPSDPQALEGEAGAVSSTMLYNRGDSENPADDSLLGFGTGQVVPKPLFAGPNPRPDRIRLDYGGGIGVTRDIRDMNGDAFPDLVDTGCKVFLGSSEGFATASTEWFRGPMECDPALPQLDPNNPWPCSAECGSYSQYTIENVPMGYVAGATVTESDLLDINGDGFVDSVLSWVQPTCIGQGCGPEEWDQQWVAMHGSRAWRVYLGTPASDGGSWGFKNFWEPDGQGNPTYPGIWSAPLFGMRSSRQESKYQDPTNGKLTNDAGTRDTRDLIDMNADGLPDLVEAPDMNTTASWKVWYNRGDGFDLSPTDFPAPYKALRYTTEDGRQLIGLFDINGDGLPDQVVVDPADVLLGINQVEWQVFFNTGQRMSPDPVIWWAPVVHGEGPHRYELNFAQENGKRVNRDLLDVNGDGLPDIVDNAGWNTTNNWFVYLNVGFGFSLTPISWWSPAKEIRYTPTILNQYGEEIGRGATRDTFDIDGDGLVDYVDFESDPADAIIYRNAGGAWCAAPSATATECATAGGPFAFATENYEGARPYSLALMKNGLGSSTHVDYRPSTDWNNNDAFGVPQLPFTMWTVTGIERDDGMCSGGLQPVCIQPAAANPDRAHYTRADFLYRYGKYDPSSRELRGFGTVEQYDAQGNLTRTFFHQDRILKGKSYAVERFAAPLPGEPQAPDSKPLRRVDEFWECQGFPQYTCPENPTGPVWARRALVGQLEYSNHSTSHFAYTASMNVGWFECPDGRKYGNVSRSVSIWLGASSGYTDTYAKYSCLTGPDQYIVDRPTYLRTEQFGFGILEQTWNTYDTTTGNLKRIDRWMDTSGSYVSPSPIPLCPEGGGSCERTSIEHDAVGNVVKVIDPMGRVTRTRYDDYEGGTQIYPYIVWKYVDGQSGQAVETAYDPECGKLLRETLPYRTTQIAATAPLPAAPSGTAYSERKYDGFCRLEKTARPGESIGTTPHQIFDYQLGGIPDNGPPKPTVIQVLTREPNYCVGCPASQQYISKWTLTDALGRVLQEQNESVVEGTLTVVAGMTTEYDNRGNVIRQYVPTSTAAGGDYVEPNNPSDPNDGAHTELEYDALGRVVTTRSPDGSVRRADHSSAWVTGSSDECFEVGSGCAGGLVVEMRDAQGNVVEKQWHDQSTLRAMTRYTYDVLGRLHTTEQWDGSQWNPNTRITITYDSLGRKLTMTDPDTGSGAAPGLWRYGYDLAGNLRYQDDPKIGQHVQFCYDGFNRVTRKYPRGDDITSSLASCGLDPNSPSFPADAVAYTYDDPSVPYGTGQLTRVRDASGETELEEFDVRGRLIAYTKRIEVPSGITEQASFSYTYDAADHVATITYPDLELVQNEYDRAGRIKGVKSLTYVGDSTRYLKNLTYDIYGRPRHIDHGIASPTAVIRESREYWGAAESFRLKRIRVHDTDGSTTAPTCPGENNEDFLNLTYSWYVNGLLEGVDDVHHGCTELSNKATYEYDGLRRLRQITDSQDNGCYDYDFLGNMVLKDGATCQSTPNLTYDNTNRPHQVTSLFGGPALQYDANGNRQSSQWHSLNFDSEDRLLDIDGGAVSFAYDYTGKRVVQDRNGEVTRYFSELAEYGTQVLRKHYFAGPIRIATWEVTGVPQVAGAAGTPHIMVAKAGSTTPAIVLLLDERAQALLRPGVLLVMGALLLWPTRRRRGLGVRVRKGHVTLMIGVWLTGTLPLPVILQPLTPRAAWAGGGGGGPPQFVSILSHYHTDHLGSTQAITSSTANLVQHVRYRPFGEIRGRYDWALQPVGEADSFGYEYTGYETETWSDLQYAGARFYDPASGLFLTHDPAREFPNPYSYTGWNPINLTDPTGALTSELVLILVFAAFVANSIQAAVQGASAGQALEAGGMAASLAVPSAVLGDVILSPVLGAVSDTLASTTSLTAKEAKLAVSSVTKLAGYGRTAADAARGDFSGVIQAGLSDGIFGEGANAGSLEGAQGKASPGTRFASYEPTLADVEAGNATITDGGRILWKGNVEYDVDVDPGMIGGAAGIAGKGGVQLGAAVLQKGDDWFLRWAKRNPFDFSTRRIGDFTEFAVSIPGEKGSYTRWVKVVNPDGRTIRVYHDTFDKTGQFLHRGVKVPGPERHIP